MSSAILRGDLPPGEGVRFAAFDDAAHHVEGKLSTSKLGAMLAPFKSEDEARTALEAIGATVTVGGGK